MGYKKHYFLFIIAGLILCLFSFQNCTKPIDYSAYESDEKLESNEVTESSEVIPIDEEVILGDLELDIYTVPKTVLTEGETFAIAAKVTSGHQNLTFNFKKNRFSIDSNSYNNGSIGQTHRRVFTSYEDRNSYSVDIYQGDTLLLSKNISLNAHMPEVDPPVDQVVNCPPVKATAYKQFSGNTYIYSWSKTGTATYTKIELLSDKTTQNLVVVKDIYIRTNYTQISPSSGNDLNKDSIRYQIATTCEDGSKSYSNILTLNLNN